MTSPTVSYHTSDRDRVCKICNDPIKRSTWAIKFSQIHIPPKLRDIHFHEGCLMRALGLARDEFGKVDGGKWVNTHDR